MFSRITPVTAGAALALAALIIGFAAFQPKAEASGEMRVAVACNPLTNSQKAQTGDSQLCRIRIRNYSSQPITNITVDRPTPNTITARYSYGYFQLNCDLSGCDPFTLQPGGTAYIFEESTFNPYQDGRGLTTATATGTQGGYPVTASGREQKSMP